MTKEELRNFWTEYGPKYPKWQLIFAAVLFLSISAFVLYQELKKLPNGKLQLFACNVGEGDAIYLKSPKGLDILVDGGPDESVLRCLSNNMPFWDRKIELMFLTHPHADHMTGLNLVLKRYQVDRYLNCPACQKLYLNDRILTGDGVEINVLWPDRTVQYNDPNLTSLVLKINDNLLMADADSHVQAQILDLNRWLGTVEVIKVPHHGSRTALLPSFLEIVRPTKAIISVGKNDFGHPDPETVKLLKEFGVKIERTDRN